MSRKVRGVGEQVAAEMESKGERPPSVVIKDAFWQDIMNHWGGKDKVI